MFKRIRNWFIHHAIKRAMRQPMPRQFFTSGQEAKVNHFYRVTLKDEEKDSTFLVDAVTEHGLEGIVANRYQTGPLYGASLLYRTMDQHKLEIRHYYRGYEIRYANPVRFLLGSLVNYPYWHRWRDIRLQAKYNTQQLVRRDRMAVLAHFLDQTIADHRYRTSSIGLITDLYGNRWVHHPDEANIQNYYELLMDSLVDSGDLVKPESIYCKLAPKALVTLDAYAEDRDRHAEANSTQRYIVYLTIVLAVIATVQVGVSVWEELHADPTQVVNPAQPS